MPGETVARGPAPEGPGGGPSKLASYRRCESIELRLLRTEASEREARLKRGGEACDERVESFLPPPRRPFEVLSSRDEDAARAQSRPEVDRRLRAYSAGPLGERARGHPSQRRVYEEREKHSVRRRAESFLRGRRRLAPTLNARLIALAEAEMAVAGEVDEVEARTGELVPEVPTDGRRQEEEVPLGLGEMDEAMAEIARQMGTLQLRVQAYDTARRSDAHDRIRSASAGRATGGFDRGFSHE